MNDHDRLAVLFRDSTVNALVGWALLLVLLATLVGSLWSGRYEPALLSLVGIAMILAPAVWYRDLTLLPPWFIIGLISLPVIWQTLGPEPFATTIVPTLAIAALGLLLAVELHRFTPLRLVPWFAVVITVLFTMAMGGLLNVLRWSADVLFGTSFLLDGRSQDAINAAVMIELIYVSIAGILAGGAFYLYFRRMSRHGDSRMYARSAPDPQESDVAGVPLSRRIGVPLSYQRGLVVGMQVVLVGIMAYGLWQRDIAVTTNALIALGVTAIPPILERDYRITIELGLVLWVTAAVFLHTLGTAGLYDAIAPWDHLTHTFSATVVAAAGYAALRGIHLHDDRIFLPRWALFGLTLVFVLAMGVVWEILEFFVDQGALMLGIDPVLAQHGIDDTIVDMLFNLIGAIIVATWGTVYLTEFSDSIATHLEMRS